MPTAISSQTLFQEAACYQCFGSLTETQMLRFALLARALLRLNPLAATDPQSLIAYASCQSCFSSGSLNDMMELALLDQIAQNSGGGGSSCLLCGLVDPVDVPACECALYINKTTSTIWYWDSGAASWFLFG